MTTAPVTTGGRTASTTRGAGEVHDHPDRGQHDAGHQDGPGDVRLHAALGCRWRWPRRRRRRTSPGSWAPCPRTISRNRIVETPLVRMASCGSRPIATGNRNVAPNMATTCWAPNPMVRGQDSRSSGRTTGRSRRWRPVRGALNSNVTGGSALLGRLLDRGELHAPLTDVRRDEADAKCGTQLDVARDGCQHRRLAQLNDAPGPLSRRSTTTPSNASPTRGARTAASTASVHAWSSRLASWSEASHQLRATTPTPRAPTPGPARPGTAPRRPPARTGRPAGAAARSRARTGRPPRRAR